MSKKWLNLTLVILFIAMLVLSACNKKSPTKSNPPKSIWTTYNTTNSGLVNDEIRAIAIDALGNKWFGTNGGVSKYHE